MKTLLILMIAGSLCSPSGRPQFARTEDPSVSQILKRLQDAVNQKDFSLIEDYLADEYEYEGMERPMSVNILKQVVQKYPKIDSLKVNQTVMRHDIMSVGIILYTLNGPSSKTILLNSEYKILQADIAALSIQGHGSNSPMDQPDPGEESTEGAPNVTMPFRLTEGGQMVVQAMVNGKNGNFIVDSGTPGSLMLNSAFHSYESKASDKPSLGVSGQMKDVSEVSIARFQWNDLEYQNLQAKTADLDHLGQSMGIEGFAGTIGYGILKDYIVEFDYVNKRLRLWNSSNSFKQEYSLAPNSIIPFTMAFHLPVIKVKIGKRELRFGLDSGAETNMLEPKWREELTADFDVIGNEGLLGADLNYTEVLKVSMNNIWFQEKSHSMDFVFASLFGGNHEVVMLDGLMGYSFLSLQKTAINYKENEMYILN